MNEKNNNNKRNIISICIMFAGANIPTIYAKLLVRFLPEDIPNYLDSMQYFLTCLSWLVFLTFCAWIIARKK